MYENNKNIENWVFFNKTYIVFMWCWPADHLNLFFLC